MIEELTLERALVNACARSGIVITRADIDHERAALVDAVLREVNDERAAAPQILERIRARRGLGPVRFEALLRRNAMLRALVRDSIEVSESEIQLAHGISAGPRARVRLLVAPTAQAALDAAARIQTNAGSTGLTLSFADEARRISTHASAGIGGDLGIVSPLDPALPEALRAQIDSAAAGQLTAIVQVGDSYGFALIEEQIDALPSSALTPARRAAIRTEIANRKERLEMERLAGRLVRDAEIQVIDPSFGWSFRTRSETGE